MKLEFLSEVIEKADLNLDPTEPAARYPDPRMSRLIHLVLMELEPV